MLKMAEIEDKNSKKPYIAPPFFFSTTVIENN
jgi:hypothetical protein